MASPTHHGTRPVNVPQSLGVSKKNVTKQLLSSDGPGLLLESPSTEAETLLTLGLRFPMWLALISPEC